MDDNNHGVLGTYELLDCIGQGGMASLYLARRAGARGFVRPVAVKVVHPHLLDDPDFVEMFIDEANVCSRLNHPNIVHVEELGEVDGQLFLVMEYVEGVSVQSLLRSTYLRKQPLPIPLAVHLMIAVADGLHAAHETRGDLDEPLEIVHRDVSPANILLSQQGHVKIIDFGIAKSTTRHHQTRVKRLKGKVAYMSPEQVHNGAVDRRSDIYSLGVVMWEMLANRRAYRAKDEVTLLKNVISRPLPPIEALRDDLPDGLVLALGQAVQRDALARFETAHELRCALAEAVPEALLVTPGQIGEYVRLASAEATKSQPAKPRLRSAVPTSSLPVPSGSYESISVEGSASQPETFNMASTPDASSRPQRSLLVPALALGCLVMGVIAAAMFYVGSQARPETVLIDPSAAPADQPAAVVQPPPAVEARPAVEVARDETAGDETEVESDDNDPPARPKARTKRRRRARARARANVAPKAKVVTKTEQRLAQPAEIAASARKRVRPQTKVDGVILADQDDLDRATTRSTGASSAKRVEQDDVVLAEEYQ